ncbi:ATP-binding protein [Kineosporia sp. NBRC 101731]|uniref:ATP-binding protein n=1 Tax=Kineosporia sp. NBRC 101731 TaxID=3032199 RepID=UPI0024A4ADA6|nr:ATP-binding protein [Kineosporia sp. NBRC 101731]GLY33371.1 hypothetical protein Kisp02_67360 [Kineosporia sp. NBRC 101731]
MSTTRRSTASRRSGRQAVPALSAWRRETWALTAMATWVLQAGDAARVPAVRHQVIAALRCRAALGSDLDSAQIVVAELLTNTFAHTPGPAWVTLSWNGSHPLLSVADIGPGFGRRPELLDGMHRLVPRLPDDDLSEHGRGLYLVAQLTHDLVVTPRPAGGCVVSATLRLRHR